MCRFEYDLRLAPLSCAESSHANDTSRESWHSYVKLIGPSATYCNNYPAAWLEMIKIVGGVTHPEEFFTEQNRSLDVQNSQTSHGRVTMVNTVRAHV